MKKLSILILALLYIGIANVSAQTDATTQTVTSVEEVKAIKTGFNCFNFFNRSYGLSSSISLSAYISNTYVQ
jgi:hypothetical protein